MALSNVVWAHHLDVVLAHEVCQRVDDRFDEQHKANELQLLFKVACVLVVLVNIDD